MSHTTRGSAPRRRRPCGGPMSISRGVPSAPTRAPPHRARGRRRPPSAGKRVALDRPHRAARERRAPSTGAAHATSPRPRGARRMCACGERTGRRRRAAGACAAAEERGSRARRRRGGGPVLRAANTPVRPACRRAARSWSACAASAASHQQPSGGAVSVHPSSSCLLASAPASRSKRIVLAVLPELRRVPARCPAFVRMAAPASTSSRHPQRRAAPIPCGGSSVVHLVLVLLLGGVSPPRRGAASSPRRCPPIPCAACISAVHSSLFCMLASAPRRGAAADPRACSHPYRVAVSAVQPFLSCLLASAPRRGARSIPAACSPPYRAASSSAVHPSRLLVGVRSRVEESAASRGGRPQTAASSSAVHPSSSCLLASAPASRSKRHPRVCSPPCCAAHQRGRPSWSACWRPLPRRGASDIPAPCLPPPVRPTSARSNLLVLLVGVCSRVDEQAHHPHGVPRPMWVRAWSSQSRPARTSAPSCRPPPSPPGQRRDCARVQSVRQARRSGVGRRFFLFASPPPFPLPLPPSSSLLLQPAAASEDAIGTTQRSSLQV